MIHQRVNIKDVFCCCFSNLLLIHSLQKILLDQPLIHTQQRKLSCRHVKHNRQRTTSHYFSRPLIHNPLYIPTGRLSIHNRQQKPLHPLLKHSPPRIPFDLVFLVLSLDSILVLCFLPFSFFRSL